jgi:hypothetical protein
VRSAHTAVALNETVLNAKQGKPRANKRTTTSGEENQKYSSSAAVIPSKIEKAGNDQTDRFRGGPNTKVIDSLKRRPKS